MNKIYKTSEKIRSYLDDLRVKHNSLCEWLSNAPNNQINFTKTINNNIVDTLKISNNLSNSNSNFPEKTSILIVSGQHAREWAPPDAICSFFEKLLESYENKKPIINKAITVSTPKPDPDSDMSSNPFQIGEFTIPYIDIKRIIDRLNIYVCPCLNPDGRDFSLNGVELPGINKNQKLFYSNWRGNLSDNSDINGIFFQGDEEFGLNTDPFNRKLGTDIGRNFNICWKAEDYFSESISSNWGWVENNYPSWPLPIKPVLNEMGEPYKDDQSKIVYEHPDTYRGKEEESELETKYLKSLMESNNLNITYFLDLHSYGGVILLPWSITENSQSTNIDHNWRNKSLDSKAILPTPNYNENRPPIQDRVKDSGTRDSSYDEFQYPSLLSLSKYIASKISDGTALASNKVGSRGYDRSKYLIGNAKSQVGYYGTGAPLDYFHSLNYPFTENPRNNNNHPLFSFVIEAGRGSEGGFHPNKTDYLKIEREIHMALYNLLSVAANWGNQFTFAK